MLTFKQRNILRDFSRRFEAKPHLKKLKWERIEDGFVERVESACARIDHKLYTFAGYQTLNRVVQECEVWDLNEGRWLSERIQLPDDIPQTHQGVEADGIRFIYHTAGQYGIQCSPAVTRCYSFDTQTGTWNNLPDLPQPRYSAVLRLWNGRLHVVGGSMPDRVTPAKEHWSLSVQDGQALEYEWREQTPIPRGGPHRSSRVLNNKLYVLAGQEGDRPPIKCDPTFRCDWKFRHETFYGDSFVLEEGGQWQRIADMPLPATHAEYSTLSLENDIYVLGGLIHELCLTNYIQAYDTETDTWRVAGLMPWRNKGLVAAAYDGWLYVGLGQKGKGRFDPNFGAVLKECYRCRFR